MTSERSVRALSGGGTVNAAQSRGSGQATNGGARLRWERGCSRETGQSVLAGAAHRMTTSETRTMSFGGAAGPPVLPN
jgi:hypothetical protein